ncbi:MAG: hypothetical protein E3J47_08170 [Candidatus Stahlbacteria bacterium]|nr:MAG: hypothetical protein E3J47_08170 [Candidatus Stahlbacteria bacterium]
MITSKVGLEAEFLLINDKGEKIIPPSSWDRDGFPLLGEIRGKEGKTVTETIIQFKAKEMEIVENLRKGHTILMADVEQVKLALYKKANKEINWEDKNAQEEEIKNIYGTDISEFSDQVVKGNKIQGIRISCGLHVHFSCEDFKKYTYDKEVYRQVILPIGLGEAGLIADKGYKADDIPAKDPFTLSQRLAKELLSPSIFLYAREGYTKEKTLTARAGKLNKPAIEYIVKEMDDAFFERFAPEKKDRTKYRQPGFFELKPYGFEYRSLPANSKTMEALPEITKKAFDLLKEINKY